MFRLILASASPRRLTLLKQIGIIPDAVLPADIDESPLARESSAHYVTRIATLKAQKIALLHTDSLILAADTMVTQGGRILGKAENTADVESMLTQLSGKTHRVFSGLCVIAPDGRMVQKAIKTSITFKHLTPHEIQTYAQNGEGVGKAGGYAIQGYAEAFVRRIIGSYSNVVGLPLYETRNALTGLGYSV